MDSTKYPDYDQDPDDPGFCNAFLGSGRARGFRLGKTKLPVDYFIAALIFSLSCLTDLADGYIARKYNLCSKFGAFLDPVADKLTVTTALVLIAECFCNSDLLHGCT